MSKRAKVKNPSADLARAMEEACARLALTAAPEVARDAYLDAADRLRESAETLTMEHDLPEAR